MKTIALLCLAALALPAHAAELFLAPTGRDTNPGTRARPMATLEAARDRLRRSPGKRVLTLLPGVYPRTATFALDKRDTGLTVRAEKAGTVTLLGGRVVTGWTPADDPRLPEAARGNVVRVDLKALGIVDLGTLRRRGFGVATSPAPLELFVDGKPQTLARWPNGDAWTTIASAPDGQAGARIGVSVEPERLARWAKADDLWLHGYWTYDWADTYEKVTAVDATAKTLTTAAPYGAYGYTPGKRFYALNLLEELDAPGEYFVDRKAGTLYFWPPAGGGQTVVSTLDAPLIRLDGVDEATLERLTLESARGAGIVVEGGAEVTVAGCTLRGLGTDGISVSGGARHRIVACDLYDIGETGVQITGGDRQSLTPAGHVVENCDIHHHSRICFTYRPAIGIQGVGNKALHNRLHDGPHNAILMGGNDHEIAFNEVFRVCTQTGDAGAIYMGRNLTMRGTVIRHNHFHDIGPTLKSEGGFVDVMAVYLDDCYCGTTIYGNIFERAGRAAMIGGGRDNVIENNLFIGCNPAIHVDARGTGWASFWFNGKDPFLMDGLKAVPYQGPAYAKYPHLADILRDEPAKAKYNRLTSNVIVGAGKSIDWLDGLNERSVETSGNIVATDGIAVGLDPKTFAVSAPGFRPIPFDKIGLVKDRWRK